MFFFFFSNISHLATFFFYSPVQVVSGLRKGERVYRWGGGAVLIDQKEEELNERCQPLTSTVLSRPEAM